MAYRIVARGSGGVRRLGRELQYPGPDYSDTTKTPRSRCCRRGQQLFTEKGCIGCHSLNPPAIPGLVGPNLHHVGSRSYIAAGTLKNTDENLAKWLTDPQAWKQGVLMPNLQLKDDEVAALVAFLRRTNKRQHGTDMATTAMPRSSAIPMSQSRPACGAGSPP